MLIDTVGLVRRLPHQLVEAFHSTLEEALQADLLLNVCDVSSPDVQEQVAVTENVIRELREQNGDSSALEQPILTVMNKCDLISECPIPVNDKVALVSAKTGLGFDALLEKISRLLEKTQVRMTLEIPFDKGALLGLIRRDGKVFSEEYTENGTKVDALVDRRVLSQVASYTLDSDIQ